MPSFRSKQLGNVSMMNRPVLPLVSREHQRWLSDEMRKNVRARYGGSTIWARKTTPSTTTDDCKITKVDLKALTQIWAGAAGRPMKRKAPDFSATTHDRPAKKVQIDETSRRPTKRRASSAADGERTTFKVKTHHSVGILKVPGSAKGSKEVRWCASVQEPRETVRPSLMASCPDPPPTVRAESAMARSRRLKNLANFPTRTAWIDKLQVPIGKSLEFEDLPDVHPLAAKPRKPMVMRYSDDLQWNRKIFIAIWDYRHEQYSALLRMHRTLDRYIVVMARRGAPMAQLLLTTCA